MFNNSWIFTLFIIYLYTWKTKIFVYTYALCIPKPNLADCDDIGYRDRLDLGKEDGLHFAVNKGK